MITFCTFVVLLYHGHGIWRLTILNRSAMWFRIAFFMLCLDSGATSSPDSGPNRSFIACSLSEALHKRLNLCFNMSMMMQMECLYITGIKLQIKPIWSASQRQACTGMQHDAAAWNNVSPSSGLGSDSPSPCPHRHWLPNRHQPLHRHQHRTAPWAIFRLGDHVDPLNRNGTCEAGTVRLHAAQIASSRTRIDSMQTRDEALLASRSAI